MNEKGEKPVDELLICYKFPPSQRVSGVVSAKRLIKSQKIMDVIQGPTDENDLDNEFYKVVDEFVNEKIIVGDSLLNSSWASIENFSQKGMEELEKRGKTYKSIKSRVGTHESHFLALEYKLKHPETFWEAEFSDPLSITIENKVRKSNELNNKESEDRREYVNDPSFIDRINHEIEEISEKQSTQFKLIDGDDTIFYLCEYLPFLFADQILFTNENQKEIMLNLYPENVRELVNTKFKVSHHPVLDEKYYHIVESDYEVSDDCINFGYFGTFLSRRHLESMYYAFETLHPKIRDKYKIHFFVNKKELLKRLIEELDIKENIIINDKIPLLEFLNLTTKFDVLIVNDLNTFNNFPKNPFLPSKLADYLGSGRNIWAFYEDGSVMSNYNLKYKSDINDYESSLTTLKQIIEDKIDLESENIDLDDLDHDLEKYIEKRIYQLNFSIAKENANLVYNRNQMVYFRTETGKLKAEVQTEKDKNKKLKSEINDKNSKNKELEEKLKAEKDKNSKNKELEEKLKAEKDKNKKLKDEIKRLKETKGWVKFKAKNLKSRI